MKINLLCTIGALAFYGLSFGQSAFLDAGSERLVGNQQGNFSIGESTDKCASKTVGKWGDLTATLYDAFSRPAQSTLNIPFELSNNSVVSLDILDQAGNPVVAVFAGELHDGYYVFSVNYKLLKEGAYSCRLATEKGQIIREINMNCTL
jgi:hypothetical protein